MGLFWDLMQQSQISDQSQRSSSLESRVARLERELRESQKLMHALIERLETNLGQDLDGDGRVG